MAMTKNARKIVEAVLSMDEAAYDRFLGKLSSDAVYQLETLLRKYEEENAS